MGSLGSGRLTWLIQDSAAVSGRLAIPAAGAGAEDEAEAEDAVGTRGALLGDGVRSRLGITAAGTADAAGLGQLAINAAGTADEAEAEARAADNAVAAACLAASSAACMRSAICSDSQASDQPNPKMVSDYCVSQAELSRSSDAFAFCSPHIRSLLKENATET